MSDIISGSPAASPHEQHDAELRLIADALPVLISYIDRNQVYRLVNRAYTEWFGLAREDIIGRTMREVLGEAAHAVMLDKIDAALAGETVRFRTLAPYREGGERFIDATYIPRLATDRSADGFYVLVVDVTDDKQAEEALAASEALARARAEELAAIYDAAPVGLCVLDRDLRYVRINERLAEINGVPVEDHIGRTVREVVPDLSDQAIAAMESVLRGEEIWDIEFSGTTPAQPGVVRFWRENWLPLKDSAGEIVGVTLSAEEITRTKAAENALHESEQRFRNMADHAPVMMWVTDPSGECTYLNRAWYAFTGQQPAEAEGFGWLEAVHPEDRDRSAEAFRQANANRAAFQLDYRLRQHDGVYRWAIDAAAPRFGADGEFLGYIGSVIDIHERKEAAQELERKVEQALAEREAMDAARREADALYRAYFENSPEALFVIGVQPDGGFVVEETNTAHQLGIGMELAAVQGKRIDDILPEPIASRVLETYRQVAETGEILQYREVFELNGVPGHWDTALVPMRDASGRIVRLIGSSRNVSRQVLAEEALSQSQKMEAIGQLTGGVAHDFNNLLTPIVGALDVLQRKGLGTEREQRLLAGALQSAERAATLVHRLLAFARRQPLQLQQVQIDALIDGLVELIAGTIGARIRIAIEVAADVPPVVADANQLEMAILNLAVNARDAMPEGGTLTITAEGVAVAGDHPASLEPGRYVRIAVTDTGLGMDAQTLARAAEPFFSTKEIGRGTGLGLSMVHGLASQLGGGVTLRSAPGEGTTVEVWLPEAAGEARTNAAAAEPAWASGQGTVLLVEDEMLVRMSTADMLAELGYAVVEASSGEEALARLGGGLAPDYLITDHAMPGMSGTELARRVRSDFPACRILVVSGYAETSEIAPEFARLGKPFRNLDLATSLAAL